MVADEAHFDILNSKEGVGEMRIATRAPIEVMFYLSKGVQVPQEHLQCGLAATTNNLDGSPFSWHDVVGDLFQIRCCDKKPNARLAVKYRDYWYYIDDCDQDSKRTLMMLIVIMAFSQIEGQTEKPVLTLPL